jgi:hypothetical protein
VPDESAKSRRRERRTFGHFTNSPRKAEIGCSEFRARVVEVGEHFFLTAGGVIDEIRSWKPRGCSTELQYRNSLHKKLEDSFPRTPPVKEYGYGRVRADIAFERKIGIELKLDLNSTTKLQRLKGQLDDYAKTFGTSVVVLVGKTDRSLLKDLNAKAYKYGVHVIEK